MFELSPKEDYDIIGEPVSLNSARALAGQNRFQFEWWALSLVNAKPTGGQKGSRRGKKGKDRGIDGTRNFFDEPKGKPKSVLFQVKSGNVKSGDIRDLRGCVEREGAAIGMFITLESPTSEMKKEAISTRYYVSDLWQKKYPKIQIYTIEELLEGKQIQMPPAGYSGLKQALKVKKVEGVQQDLDI